MHSVLYPRKPSLLITRMHCPDYKSTGRYFCRSARVQKTRLPAYCWIILPPCCMHTRAASWELPCCSGRIPNCMHECALLAAALLQWQKTKLHVCACRCPAVAAGSQTAVTVMQWQDTKLHARMRTATLLQWQDTKLHARMRTAGCCPAAAAVAGNQTACMRMPLSCCSSRFSNCSHCNAVAGYQTACTNAHCCPAAVAGYQTACARGCPAVAVSQTA
jgi:hypothetical protein